MIPRASTRRAPRHQPLFCDHSHAERNHLLLITYNSHINEQAREIAPPRHRQRTSAEVKFQLSAKATIWQDILEPRI